MIDSGFDDPTNKLPVLKCVVCETTHERGSDSIGQWTDEIDGKPCPPYPVCRECHEIGRHESWRRVAIEELRASTIAFVSEGNLAADIGILRSYKKHDSRIEDGVCPNGCALMLTNHDRHKECSVCGFVLIQQTLCMPPEAE